MFKVNVDLIFIPSLVRLADEVSALHLMMKNMCEMDEQDLQVRIETCKNIADLLPEAIEDMTNIMLAEHIAEGHIIDVMDQFRNVK